jgi:hypothetical protein
MCRFPIEQRPELAQAIVRRVVEYHSRTLDYSDYSDVPLAGVTNNLQDVFTNSNWVKFQGKEGDPNYLVMNMTREKDAPGFKAALAAGDLPYLKAQVARSIEAGLRLYLLLPHVQQELDSHPGMVPGCDNVYANFYYGNGMGEHADGPPSADVLWARGIEKYRLLVDPKNQQALFGDIEGTQYGLMGMPVGDTAFEVQLQRPAASLTLNGARCLKYGQTNLYHRYRPSAQALREGPIISLQVAAIIHLCAQFRLVRRAFDPVADSLLCVPIRTVRHHRLLPPQEVYGGHQVGA